VPSEHEPNQPNEPDQPDDERAWDQALRRARNEFAEEDTDVVGKSAPGAATPGIADDPSELAAEPPIELTHARRKRRTSRPYEAVLPPQQVTVRRRRQTGRMSLATPDAEDGRSTDLPQVDLAPPEPEPPATPAPPPLDGGARSRERSREREALERVLALAKPRTRHTRPTPAVLPPRPLPGTDDDGSGAP
jgi:hypothetical protein